MRSYTIQTDTNTIWMKIIRYIGTLFLGFFIGATFIKYKYSMDIDWMNFTAGTLCSLSLSVFPGMGHKPSITVNKDGIFAEPGNLANGGLKTEYRWDHISSVGLQKNRIRITTPVGSQDYIRLPYFTRSQWSELEEVLDEYDEWLKEGKRSPEGV